MMLSYSAIRTFTGPPAGYNFTATAGARSDFVSGGSSSQTTVDDHVRLTTTGSTTDVGADITVVEDGAEEVRGAGIRFESLDPSIATVNQNGRVDRVTDGTARVLIGNSWLKKRLNIVVSRETDQTVVEFVSWVTGTLGKHCSDALDAMLGSDIYVYQTANHGTLSYTRNSSLWCGSLDLTGVSPWNSHGGEYRGVTAIGRRHCVASGHWYPEDGASVRFITADNQIITRTVVGHQHAINGFDTPELMILRLDSDLPASIKSYKFTPELFDYIPLAQTAAEDVDSNSRNIMGVPMIQFHGGREKVSVNELHYVFYYEGELKQAIVWPSYGSTPERLALYHPAIGGDSGSPHFLVVNGEPVIVGGIGSMDYMSYTSEINDAITALGGGETVSIADFSEFTNYAP